MGNEVIRPIDEVSARAIAEASIFGGKVVDAGTAGANWFAGVLGKLPHNLVGIIDDQVVYVRARRWAELNADLDRRLIERGVKDRIEPSFSVLLPLVEAAIDETRQELKELWERLLANAFDPARQDQVRLSFVELLKKLDPFDAVVLQVLGEVSGAPSRRHCERGYEWSVWATSYRGSCKPQPRPASPRRPSSFFCRRSLVKNISAFISTKS
jgi:hypothetical protein